MSEFESQENLRHRSTIDTTKNRSRGFSSQMTPESIGERLQIMSDLSRACNELGRAKRIGKIEPQSHDAPP